MTYNGWTNYETWNIALWLDNDGFEVPKMATYDLALYLKEMHEDAMPELQGCFADILNAAMSEVNWYEIAEHLQELEEDEE